MHDKNTYSEAQMELLRRIEKMDISDSLRDEILELKNTQERESSSMIRGETRIIGFRPNPA